MTLCSKAGLQPGTYTLVVSTHASRQECEYELELQSTTSIVLKPIPQEGAGLFSRTVSGSWCVARGPVPRADVVLIEPPSHASGRRPLRSAARRSASTGATRRIRCACTRTLTSCESLTLPAVRTSRRRAPLTAVSPRPCSSHPPASGSARRPKLARPSPRRRSRSTSPSLPRRRRPASPSAPRSSRPGRTRTTSAARRSPAGACRGANTASSGRRTRPASRAALSCACTLTARSTGSGGRSGVTMNPSCLLGARARLRPSFLLRAPQRQPFASTRTPRRVGLDDMHF